MSDRGLVDRTGGNDPLKQASGGGKVQKARLVCRWCVWRVQNRASGRFGRKWGFLVEPETHQGGVSEPKRAVRLISGARGFSGGSWGLKSPARSAAGWGLA